ncbi:hypothetical protein PIB30_016287 [Stylosanthes scabra]|uniref:Uncharacterized protein n=1 Tax=Stylosanthes scabra TaxID=79078 RepID=A0ABU6Q873_9FABA|nr:hypothetical protein [Stylosanthes scabra]
MTEVEVMGFANFQHIPEWIVNQEIYMYLVTKFDFENNLIKDDVANIEINVEIVERALGLPSGGDEFPEYYPDDLEYEALKSSDDQEEGEGYNAQEEEQINNERDDQSEEGVVEDEEVLKKWTQIEEELKSQRRTVGIEKKKLTKEQEAEVEATLKHAAECFLDDFDGYDEGIPSFSFGFSQDFKSPTHTPKRSMQEEILDIAPLNEIIPENISFQEPENLINMGPTRELTADEQKKIYNWVMKASKEDGVQEEMIAKLEWRYSSHLSEFDRISNKGEYFEMNPNLGLDKEDFDKEKAATRQWEQLNDIRRKLVIEIATSRLNTHRIAVFQKSSKLPQGRNNSNRVKKKEVKMPFTAPSTKEITKRAEGNKAAEKRKKK